MRLSEGLMRLLEDPVNHQRALRLSEGPTSPLEGTMITTSPPVGPIRLSEDHTSAPEGPIKLPEAPMRISEDSTSPPKGLSGCQSAL